MTGRRRRRRESVAQVVVTTMQAQLAVGPCLLYSLASSSDQFDTQWEASDGQGPGGRVVSHQDTGVRNDWPFQPRRPIRLYDGLFVQQVGTVIAPFCTVTYKPLGWR